MRRSKGMFLFFSTVTALSVLFGINAHLQKARETQRRLYVEESLMRVTRAKLAMGQELEAQKVKAASLERQLVGVEQAHQFTLARLRTLERRFTRLQRDLVKLRVKTEGASEEIDLGQIVVSAAPSMEGKVLAVNRQFKFIVVDLGQEHHLPVGTVLSIYRDKEFVGRVQVEEVRESVAACRILPEWTRQEIQENDLAREM